MEWGIAPVVLKPFEERMLETLRRSVALETCCTVLCVHGICPYWKSFEMKRNTAPFDSQSLCLPSLAAEDCQLVTMRATMFSRDTDRCRCTWHFGSAVFTLHRGTCRSLICPMCPGCTSLAAMEKTSNCLFIIIFFNLNVSRATSVPWQTLSLSCFGYSPT